MSSANYIFSLASTVIFIRCEKTNPDLTESLLKNLSWAFGQEDGGGTYIYNVYKSTPNLSSNNQFLNTDDWKTLENSIEGSVKSKIGIASLLYTFLNYSNLEYQYQEYYINKLNSYIYNGKAPKYFTYEEIDSIKNSISLNAINQAIKNQTNNRSLTKLINYNWYDSEPLFDKQLLKPKLRKLIKDSENQYYCLSGELLYDVNLNFPNCIEQETTISTPNGNKTIKTYNNFPCFEKESYVGPVTGVKFYRIFNDGPPSSGYFDSGTMEAYKEFDENISNLKDYSSNKENLYSFSKDNSGDYIYLCKNVQIDSPGFISSDAEYGIGHTNVITDVEGCRWEKEELETLPLMRMHQGDNFPKYHFFKVKVGNECETGISLNLDWTGWKFANFELKDSWIKYFDFINTNPRSEKNRILKRALNIENYYEIVNGQKIIHSPYLNASDNNSGYLECEQYVGPPQLNLNSNSFNLPGFAFYQNFDNLNFGTGNTPENTGDYAEINLYPAISVSNFSETGAKSSRNIQVSNYNLFSQKDLSHGTLLKNAKIDIKKTIYASEMTGFDNVFRQCIAIGDNFQNKITSSSSLQSNAGYTYTGFTFYESGKQIELSDLFNSQNVKKVAGEYPYIKYITGYLDNETQQKYSIEAFSTHINSGQSLKKPGDYLVYYYFNTINGEGTINSVNTGWSTFAPIPLGVYENLNRYKPLYSFQRVENYFPRYSNGPFATYENKILYPNANLFYSRYNSRVNGFPNKISYVIKVKEECVREYFATSGIQDDGIIKYKEVFRAGKNGIPSGLKSLMIKPFVSNDDIYGDEYDFNKNKKLYSDSGSFNYQSPLYGNSEYVDAFYVPSTEYCPQTQLNSTTYQYYEQNIFSNGILITGRVNKRTIYSKNNQTKDISVIEPIARGLTWGYAGKILSGSLLYNSPIFDLSLLKKNVNESMVSSFVGQNKIPNDSVSTEGACSKDGFIINGKLFENSYNGRDPIFYEYIGGRLGEGSDLEGGYHRKGIIGDSWYNFYAEDLAFRNCGQDTRDYRYPYDDKYLMLFSLNSGSLDIFTKGLYYYPLILNSNYKPFYSSTLYDIGINTNSFRVGNEYYYNFNLKDKFYPLKTGSSGQLYYESGLEIGPFDRDVELCVFSGNSINPSGAFIVDGKFYTTTGYVPPGQMISCGQNYLDMVNTFTISEKIAPGSNGRNKHFTTFKLVPSGKKANINISGIEKVGLDKDAIVTIRPRTTVPAVTLGDGSPYFSGDFSTANPLLYTDNGSESKFSFKYNQKIDELVGQKFEYISAPRYQLLFPKPNSSNFEQVLGGKISFDDFGNKIYRTVKGPTYDYWKEVNPNLEAAVFRDVSKISFEIISIDTEYGEVPFQSHKIIIPSGNCIVSGSFFYTGQADSVILSQGVFLSGYSGASSLTGIIDPYYISDVLKRLPSGIEVLPSGSGIRPVLEAPSYMKRRKNVFSINGSEEYVNYSPLASLNYNKFIWPALSDLAILNPSIVYEKLLPSDDITFSKNYLTFSASQGQQLFSGESGMQNPNENVSYQVKSLYAFVDSVATNSIYNTGKCILKTNGDKEFLDSGNLSGILAVDGITLSLYKKFKNL